MKRGFIDFLRKNLNSTKIFLIIIFLSSFYLHFRNLEGTAHTQPDEERAFALLSTGPLIYLMCRPIYDIFGQEDIVFYFVSLLGFINIFLFYYLTKKLFKDKISIYATLFYSVFPMRINYSRYLYPGIFLDFFFLNLLISLYWGINKNRLFFILTGVFIVFLIYTHMSVYSLLFGLCIGVGILCFYYKVSLKRFLIDFLFIILGCVISIIFLEIILHNHQKGYFFLGKIFLWKDNIKKVVVEGELKWFFKNIIFLIKSSYFNVFRTIFVLLGAFIFTWNNIKNKNIIGIVTTIVLIIGVGVFLLNTWLGSHIIRDRHFVWLCAFLSLSLGYLIVWAKGIKSKIFRYSILFCGLLFWLSSFYTSYLVSEENFNILSIRKYLQENNIELNKIATNLVSLGAFYKKGDQPYLIPTLFDKNKERYYINWSVLFFYYLRGEIKYIVPSGLGLHAYLYCQDPLLKFIQPQKKWLHPDSYFRHRIFIEGGSSRNKECGNETLFISLYNLDDVFSDKNIGWVIFKNNFIRR